MKIERINIIGVGNVGSQLAKQISYHKTVVSIFSRNFEKARGVASRLGATPISNLSKISEDVDLNLISITDDGIEEVLALLPKHIPVVHTSGSVSINVLKQFENHGILYPLQTFSKNRAVAMNKVPFLIETNNSIFEEKLVEFARTCFSEMTEIVDSEKRKIIHLAAVVSANFTNHLLAQAKQILDEGGIPFDILQPLMQEIVSKAFDLGPIKAQTGPAHRGDNKILNEHMRMLGENDFAPVYESISDLIQKFKAQE